MVTKRIRPPLRLAVCTALSLVALAGGAGQAWAVYRDGFDTATPSWRLADSDCGVRLAAQERTFQQAAVHNGAGAEYLRLFAGQGSYAHVTLDLPPTRVIEELRPSLWVKANRAGIRLRARVVFPRSRDPRDGSLLAVYVEGDVYDQPGAWRQLFLRDLPLQVQRQARLKRAQPQFGQVDEREAYIDTIVINAYTGPGATDLWLDDLEVEGFTEVNVGDWQSGAVAASDASWRGANGEIPAPPKLGAAPADAQPPHLEGQTLVAGAGPVAARMIEHQGESFAWLKSHGFNVVRLARPPTPEELEEARRIDLWIVAPPPHVTGRTAITAAHDRVVAWDLGSGLGRRELESVRSLAYNVRRDDPRSARPLLAGPREQVWGYRRFSDVLLVGDEPLGSGRTLSQFRSRVSQQAARGSRPGPTWTNIQTTPRKELLEQLDALAGNRFAMNVEAAQLRLLVYAALEAGASGVCYRSPETLEGADPATQYRTTALHAINEELALVEPWIAGASYRDKLEIGVEGVRATAWSTDRSKLILLARHQVDDQFTAAPASPQPVSFLLTGAPPSWKAYRISAGHLTPVWSSQVGGGMRIQATDVERAAWIVVTDDPLTLNFLANRLRQSLQTRAKLAYEILTREMATLDEVLALAPPEATSKKETQRAADEARAALRQCERLLDASDFAGSLVLAARCEQPLAYLRRLLWSETAGGFSSRVASPCCIGFAALPLHWDLMRRVRVSTWGPNSLAAGDFEDVQRMQATGWTQHRHPQFEGQTQVELSPDRPQQGRYSLHLQAASATGAAAANPDEEAPLVRVVSAPVPVERGAVVRIAGWVRATAESTSQDETPLFRISDSFGGEALADYRRAGSGEWTPFALYRAAPRQSQLTVAFDLLSAGDVWIDAIHVDVLQPPPVLPGSPGAPPHQGAQGLSSR